MVDNDLNLISLPGSPLIIDALFVQALKRVDWKEYDYVVSDIYLTNIWGDKGIFRLHEPALFKYFTWLNKNKRYSDYHMLEEAREIAPVNRNEYGIITSYPLVISHDIDLLNSVYKTNIKYLPYIIVKKYKYCDRLLMTDCQLVEENGVDDCLYVAKLLKYPIIISGKGLWLPNLRAIAKANRIDAYFMDNGFNECSTFLDMSLKFNNYNSNTIAAAMGGIQTITTNETIGFDYIDVGDIDNACSIIRHDKHIDNRYGTDWIESIYNSESVVNRFEKCLID